MAKGLCLIDFPHNWTCVGPMMAALASCGITWYVSGVTIYSNIQCWPTQMSSFWRNFITGCTSKVVEMTTSGVASEENFTKMTTFPFQQGFDVRGLEQCYVTGGRGWSGQVYVSDGRTCWMSSRTLDQYWWAVSLHRPFQRTQTEMSVRAFLVSL